MMPVFSDLAWRMLFSAAQAQGSQRGLLAPKKAHYSWQAESHLRGKRDSLTYPF